jgi:hypothetical protein
MEVKMAAESSQFPFKVLLRRVLAFMAVLIVGRFVLEVAGVPEAVTRYFSSSAGIFLAAIYLAAVGPLRGGLRTLKEIPVPALILSACTVGLVVILTVISALLHIERSHFAGKEDSGSMANLGQHLLGHMVELVIFFVLTSIIMAAIQTMWRWPVTVGPAAFIGALVIIRFTGEVMGFDAARVAAYSSTLAVFISAFFLGAMSHRAGYATAKQLFVPAFALAFVWRFFILLVTLLSAFVPFFKTHFFDPTQGQVAMRLLRFIGTGVLLEGVIIGLLVWGIAVWISRATKPVEVA